MLRLMMSAALVSGAVMIGHAVAAPVPQSVPARTKPEVVRAAPLQPGRAASIREAQGIGRPLLYWGAAGAVIVTGVLLLYEGDNGTVVTTTTGQ